MVNTTPINSNNNAQNIKILESQIRECFGRIVWTHKIHEKCSDIYAEQLKQLKIIEIVLSALTTTSLLSSILIDQKVGTIIGVLFSTIILIITIYTKDYDLGKLSQNHAEVAHELWNIRESYLSLITDIKANILSFEQIQIRRDKLQKQTNKVYENAPRTNYKAYQQVSKALNKNGQVNVGQEMTFTDTEIDRFLPNDLRRNISTN